MKRANAKRLQRLNLEAQNGGSSGPSRETTSLRQEELRRQSSLYLQRRQQAEARKEKIRLNYDRAREIVPSTATSMSEAAKAAKNHWKDMYAEGGRIQRSVTGSGPDQEARREVIHTPSDTQVAGRSEVPHITGLPATYLNQRSHDAGVIDSGSSRGHLSQDPLTQSTDESRNATSTPGTSTEARPGDQEEIHANRVIKQEAKTSGWRMKLKRWLRRG